MRKTELLNSHADNLDRLSTQKILHIINDHDATVATAVRKEIAAIAKMVDIAVEVLNQGGRIIYLGSGASADVANSDAQEMEQTYGIPWGTFRSLHLQLGPNWNWEKLPHHQFTARDQSEDNAMQLIHDLQTIKFTPQDLVIGISASGATKPVIEAIQWAQKQGAQTAIIAMNRHTLLTKFGAAKVIVNTGPEIVNGSTRMKAATATKLVLNMFSTAVMARLGHIYNGYMVGLKIGAVANQKLYDRSVNMIAAILKITNSAAQSLFEASHHNIKAAIVMRQKQITLAQAVELLEKHKGNIRAILDC